MDLDMFGNTARKMVGARADMRPVILFFLLLSVSLLGGCSGCEPENRVAACVEGVDCPLDEACTNVPRIVRTTFEPKEGRVPFAVSFSVVAEDPDTIVCDETLTYHYDFDGDGIEDYTSKKGRAENIYKTSGKYDIKIWVTDSANRVSKPVSKFVVAEDNKAPVIAYLGTTPTSVGIVNGNPFLFSWSAYDPDGGTLSAMKVDFGDGTPVLILKGDITMAAHSYAKAGQFDIKVTAVDVDLAESSRSTAVVVVVRSRPSSLVQTVGTSQAIAIDDNDGQYFSDSSGDFLYGYIADGPIALKTVKYPLSAFAATSPQGNAELIGWADPGNRVFERWNDIVRYRNLVVVSGSSGFQVFNIKSDASSRPCTQADYEESKANYYAGNVGVNAISQDCYPGTPTQPASICPPTIGNGFTWGGKAHDIQLLFPSSNTAEAWAIGNTPPGTSSFGGLQALRLDGLLSDDYYVGDPVGCPGGWFHKGWDTFGNPNILAAETNGMVIDGDYAYLGVRGNGFHVVNVGSFESNRQSPIPVTFRLNTISPYIGMQTNGYGVALAKSRFVSDTLTPENFHNLEHRYAKYNFGEMGDCNELKDVVAAGTTKWDNVAVVKIASAKGALILPGNRISIQTASTGVDDNGGYGYLVTGVIEAASSIVIEYESAPTSAVGDWVSVYPSAVSYGVLPAYPGFNAVVYSTSQAGVIAQNGLCHNFINAYAPVTADVGVQFQTAPLGFVALTASPDGMLVFDQSDPASPRLLPYVPGGSPAEQIMAHENYLYISGGSRGKVSIVDISDPYHMDLNALETGTNCYPCAGTSKDFSINRMKYLTTSNNPKGVLMIPGGPVGMNALSVADALEADKLSPGYFGAHCPADAVTNACLNKVSGLQLQHEGVINDIQLIGNQYALASQKQGGVLVFDTSAIPYGGSVTFVSHIRTTGDPRSIRVVTDSTGAPQSLWIADSTSVYRVEFSDPAHPGSSMRISGDGKFNFNCVEYTSGTIFVCYSIYDPANPANILDKTWISAGDSTNFKNLRLATNDDSLGKDHCSPLASTLDGNSVNGGVLSGFLNLSAGVLAGRYMMFAETEAYGNVLRELITGPGGEILVEGNNATGCQWNDSSLGSKFSRLSYQDRKGPFAWKRLYTVSSGGVLRARDVDGYEAELAEDGFDTNIGPAILGIRDLSAISGGSIVYVQKMVALGPYVFIAAAEDGAVIVDASRAENMQIIGQTNYTVGAMDATTINAMAYTTGDPGDPATRYTYTVLVADKTSVFGGEGSGIRLIEFPDLEHP